MEIKYIKTLNHIKRCNEIDGLDISEPPLELTAAQYRASCRWLNENNFIYAAFVEGGGIEAAKLIDAGQAALDDYHDELMVRMKPIATDFELRNIGLLVLADLRPKIFDEDPQMEDIDVLEGVLRIAEAKVPGMAAKEYASELLRRIDQVGEFSSSEDLCFNAFANLVKVYAVLRYRFRDNGHYEGFVYPVLRETMDDIRVKPQTVLGKYKEKLATIYKRIFRNPEEFHGRIDNQTPHFDEDKIAESMAMTNNQTENINMHSDEEYQSLLNKIQVLEADNKRLREENGELVRKLNEQEEPLVEESEESEEDRMLILGELKENIYPAEIRAHIASVLLRKALGKDISQTWAAGILVRNITIFGTPGYLQKKINSDMTFDASYYKDICGEVNCLLERIGIDYRIKCKYKGNETFDMPTADWNDMKRKYPKIEKKLPETP